MSKLYDFNYKLEEVQLKNTVKTEGLFFKKQRFAVLTRHKFLIYKNQDKFLDKKKPKVKIYLKYC
jgi:hypothetical protein